MTHALAIRHRLKRGAAEERGQTMVELALGLPVVMLMTFGFIQFCLVLFGMSNMAFASRAALRYATMHSSTSYTPTTQATLNSIVGTYIIPYPTNTWSVSVTYYNQATQNSGGFTNNVVNSGVYVTTTITYGIKFYNSTYNGLSFSSTGCGIVLQ
jgi:Flp pilus assembly protein TadG